MLVAPEPGFKVEAWDDVGLVAVAEGCAEGAGGGGGVEHGESEEASDGPGAGVGFEDEHVLGNEVEMGELGGFGEAGGAGGVESGRSGLVGGLVVVKADPVGLAMLEQIVPLEKAFRRGFPLGIEDDDILARHTIGIGRLENIG